MFLVLALVCFLGAIALLGRFALAADRPSGVARSLEALEHISASPKEMAEEIEVPFTDRVLAPLQARALTVGRRITGADQAERIRRRLDFAGNPRDWSVDRVIGLKVLSAVILPAGGLMFSLAVGFPLPLVLLTVIGAAALGFFAPDLYLSNETMKRSDTMRRSLADTVDLLAISVEAGLGFDAALQQVSEKTEGPLAEEFSRVLREMQLGMGRSEALRSLATRTNVEDIKAFVGAMVQADAFGIPIGQVLRVQSKEMRLKRRQHAEAKAQQVPVKIMVPLVICILPCLFIVILGPAGITIMQQFGSLR